MRRANLLITVVCMLAATLSAGEKKMMHCFAFTVIPTATEAEWAAFEKTTDAMPSKMPGVSKVWHGKLRAPLTVYNTDAETRKKFTDATPAAEGKFTRLIRQHGVCMEMDGPETLKTYTANPYHKEWMEAYVKVRQAGTTTYDILGK